MTEWAPAQNVRDRPSSRDSETERVLVCLLASTRAHQLTFHSFQRQVLDELKADLALALLVDEEYDYSNPFWRRAKYRWTVPAFDDYGRAFDLAQRQLWQQNVPAPNWRSMLRIKGTWQGGIQSEDPQRSMSSILPFCRWLLLHHLREEDILDRYDRFIVTRSDFVWLCPHPPLANLGRRAIWVPDGQDWGGVNDRHLVASRDDIENYLNVIDEVLLNPEQLYEEMKNESDWNDEKFLAHHLHRKGILKKVRRFPYVMYLARPLGDNSPTWSRGLLEPSVGHYVKYVEEFRAATAYATIIRSRVDWERGDWKQFDLNSVVRRPAPLLKQVYYRILDRLLSSDRIKRLNRFLKRIITIRWLAEIRTGDQKDARRQ